MEYGGLVDEDAVVAGLEFGTLGEAGGGGDDIHHHHDDDVVEELLVDGCWVEASDNNNYLMGMMLQPPQYIGGGGSEGGADQQHMINHHHHGQIECASAADQEEMISGFVVGKRWWIGPRANPGPSSSVKERLVVAVGYLKEYTKNSSSSSSTNVLIQIWVPLRHRRRSIHNISHYHHHHHQHHSTTTTSANHHHHHHPVVEDVQVRFFRSHEYSRRVQAQQYGSLALPVFERGSDTCLGVLEILVTNHQTLPLSLINNYRPSQLLDNLSNALQAVDFRGNYNSNHHQENMINPPVVVPPAVKVFDELYQAAVNEIVEVLASVCKTHNLPLALTWAPCIQQGKGGCSSSSSSSSTVLSTVVEEISCVSTVDSACFVGDVDVLGFQEACYEYHLFHGQGIVGTAFTTTKPCFAVDITAFSKAEYPLAHHAKMFGLHAAVAIPLRSVYTGSAADFVLEFFLPKECRDSEEQKQMLNSLSLVVQQACRSLHLHVVMMMEDDEEQQQYTLPPAAAAAAAAPSPAVLLPLPPSSHSQVDQVYCSSKESSCSWIAHMMEAQHKGKGVSVSLEYLQEPKEEFKVLTSNWEREATTTSLFSDFGGSQVVMEQSSNSRASTVSVEGGEESGGGGGGSTTTAGGGGRRSSSSGGGRKSGDKRRTKAEKTISLPVLRQYFAGSLKDAAKSIGVCPTTLKRICRQHGITRWPSRKIKKVGHSLKKLQLVIDSVQGAEGAIQIGSFYASFPELSSATGRSSNSNPDHIHNNNNNNNNTTSLYGGGDHGVTTGLKSPQSASSFASTIGGGGGGGNQTNLGDILMTESSTIPNNPDDHHTLLLRRAHSEAELHHHHHHASMSIMQQQQQQQEEEDDTKQYYFNSSQQTLVPPPSSQSLERGAFRVKATFADEKIRFSLQPIWCYTDLEMEIARRFNLNDMGNLVVKYLDDEGEWVVLGCDADLEECKDLHRSSQSRTIRLSLFQASPFNNNNTSCTFRNTSSPS